LTLPEKSFLPRIDDSVIPASGIRHPASGIRHPASGIRHPASGIRHPASGIRHPASGFKAVDSATAPGLRPGSDFPAGFSAAAAWSVRVCFPTPRRAVAPPAGDSGAPVLTKLPQ